METRKWWQHPVTRNLIGLAALLLAYYIPDRIALQQREGLRQIAPYFFIVGLYVWIVFHNRYLFDRLYLTGKKRKYIVITILFLLAGSLNMHLIITLGFGDYDTLPRILSFWIFTLTGLGIHVLYRYRNRFFVQDTFSPPPVVGTISQFRFMADGREQNVPIENIQYVESLENYVRLITHSKIFLIRLSMKEAELRLPRPPFLRISRSHIINTAFVKHHKGDSINIGSADLRIGKVYKRFVEEALSRSS